MVSVFPWVFSGILTMMMMVVVTWYLLWLYHQFTMSVHKFCWRCRCRCCSCCRHNHRTKFALFASPLSWLLSVISELQSWQLHNSTLFGVVFSCSVFVCRPTIELLWFLFTKHTHNYFHHRTHVPIYCLSLFRSSDSFLVCVLMLSIINNGTLHARICCTS